MKISHLNVSSVTKLIAAAVVMASGANAALINVDVAGINITNTRGNDGLVTGVLVKYVDQRGSFAPRNNSPATRLDWLDTGGAITLGQVQGYNLITSSSLAQPGLNSIDDDDASGNAAGYTLLSGFTHYITAHYGGYHVAWAVNAAGSGNTYQVPSSINLVNGVSELKGGGLSNVRAFQGARISRVPDGGATLALFGISLLGLRAARCKFAKR